MEIFLKYWGKKIFFFYKPCTVATYLIKQVHKSFLWDVNAIVIGPWAMGKPIRCCFSSESSPSITVPRPRPFRSAAFPPRTIYLIMEKNKFMPKQQALLLLLTSLIKKHVHLQAPWTLTKEIISNSMDISKKNLLVKFIGVILYEYVL